MREDWDKCLPVFNNLDLRSLHWKLWRRQSKRIQCSHGKLLGCRNCLPCSMHQIELSCWDRFLMVSCTQSDNGPWDNGPYRTVEPLPIEDGMQDLAGQIAIAMKAGLLGVLEWPEVCVSPRICVLCVTCANVGGAWASTHRTQIPTTDQCEAKKALAPVPRCLVSPQKIYSCISFHCLKSFQSLLWWDPLWAFATNLMLLANLDEPNEQRASDKRWPEYDAKMCKAMQFMCTGVAEFSLHIFEFLTSRCKSMAAECCAGRFGRWEASGFTAVLGGACKHGLASARVITIGRHHYGAGPAQDLPLEDIMESAESSEDDDDLMLEEICAFNHFELPLSSFITYCVPVLCVDGSASQRYPHPQQLAEAAVAAVVVVVAVGVVGVGVVVGVVVVVVVVTTKEEWVDAFSLAYETNFAYLELHQTIM